MNQLVELKLTEIAARINKHLRRLERKDQERRKMVAQLPASERQPHDADADYFHAGASVSGSKVHVCYISYQGASNLTRAEAAHYLFLLDQGKEGRHFELFRESEPPKPADPDIKFIALIRVARTGSQSQYALYGVTRRTTTRVYGRPVKTEPYTYPPSFIDRTDVIRWQATEEDLGRIIAARAAMDEEIRQAKAKFYAVVGAIEQEGGGAPEEEDEA